MKLALDPRLAMFMLLLITACQKSELPTNVDNVPEQTASLEITAAFCEDRTCQDKSPLSSLSIELYPTLEDAMDDTSLLTTRSTNAAGKVFIPGITEGAVYIKAFLAGHGTYISYNSLGVDVTAYHEIIFVKDFFYDSNDILGLEQTHLSFEKPIVGQTSRYRFHYKLPSLSVDIPEEYTETNLVLRLEEELEENSFIVSEYLDDPVGCLGEDYSAEHRNIWTFTEDSLIVQDLEMESIKSPVFSLGHEILTDRFSLSLQAPDSSLVGLEDQTVNDHNWNEISGIEDFELFDQQYGSNNLFWITKTFIDGDDVFLIYSKTHGLIRQILVSRILPRSEGFDLIR